MPALHVTAIRAPMAFAIWMLAVPTPDAPAWVRHARELTPGYQTSTLYRLPAGCPVGYDPTRPPG